MPKDAQSEGWIYCQSQRQSLPKPSPRYSPAGAWVHSYTMLTINADDHALMRNFHKPGDEKRMVVILPEAAYDDWLKAPTVRSMDFMRQYPEDRITASV